MLRFRFCAALASMLLAACRTGGPAPAVEPELGALVPLGATALAFVDLDQLRAAPLAGRLPANVAALLEPFREAHRVLIAARGVELLAIARGAVPGATQAPQGISLLGAPGMIAAATVVHLPSPLLAAAEPIARGHAVWIVAQGGLTFPLEGNLANVNTLLRDTESAALTVALQDPMTVELTARCTTPATALHFEQTVRAIVSITAATTRKQPAMTALWDGIQLTRDDRTVRASAAVGTDALAQLLK